MIDLQQLLQWSEQASLIIKCDLRCNGLPSLSSSDDPMIGGAVLTP